MDFHSAIRIISLSNPALPTSYATISPASIGFSGVNGLSGISLTNGTIRASKPNACVVFAFSSSPYFAGKVPQTFAMESIYNCYWQTSVQAVDISAVGAIRAFAQDNAGNIYFPLYNRVYLLDAATGATTVVAGTAAAGFADGGGTSARFNFTDSPASPGVPAGGTVNPIAIDPSGQRLFVMDQARLRMISLAPGGGPAAVTTVAGSDARGLVDGVGTAAQFLQDPDWPVATGCARASRRLPRRFSCCVLRR